MSNSPEPPKLARVLTLLDATMINAGGIIGSGIFMVPATIALLTGSTSLILAVWVFGGLISLFGALSVAELGAAMPRAGGQFVYLNEAYGPAWGYLYGWSCVAVINTASIAAVGVAFSEYLGFFFPLSTMGIKSVAILSVILLTIINILDVKSGARAQNIFTLLKIGAILGIISLGLVMDGGSAENIQPFYPDRPLPALVGPLGLAMVSVLWTYDGWIFITYVAGEVKNPGRNIPLSLVFCMLIVISIYLLINFVFTYTLGIGAMGTSMLVASDSASIFLGEKGAALVSIIILISLLGANNGFILTSARINYAMARDKLFFQQAAKVHPKFKSPANALVIQAMWASVLTFSGTYNQLITYIIFASWIFYAMSCAAVIILRKKRPEMKRPYKTPGYPYIPIIFILFAVFLTFNTILEAPRDAAVGAGIILAGLPLYFYWKKT
ncbi:MAG: amino acid permease [Candidatus Marinimicrobia bacterium]|jgi:APA family basic amino acid/polyamine antiporter|nr:amino acid permease [Candidatus Neomarinimicrobiota bacterium]MDP6615257.1 amino acid permease [Candidatus Neomarinimicrobiota bacterium]MDP6820966.1 amino acid permease [Candidatus Neomarinimicrobiota bacterium]MED5219081.1 amino acid permease [Candidatus Neomarinimicrobiota bacterium]HJM96282.1 amino acid permease [Candidatus Neomarinimicrobiota bacterium]|tara:strand:- start:3724 stop:5046 length:1323 start_codon:yes stop_codon:yes gene_type:complete